jgi:hypothetical protein
MKKSISALNFTSLFSTKNSSDTKLNLKFLHLNHAQSVTQYPNLEISTQNETKTPQSRYLNIFEKLSNKKKETTNNNLEKQREELVGDGFSLDLISHYDFNRESDILRLYKNVELVKSMISTQIEKLNERGPNLESLQETCNKLNEKTQELELTARVTHKKFNLSKKIKQNQIVFLSLFIFTMFLCISIVYLTNLNKMNHEK